MKKYSTSHEWAERSADDLVLIGISDYAQEALGDIVYVELPPLGNRYDKGEVLAEVESVKAVSAIYAPVAGTISEVNGLLDDQPELLNQQAETTWIVKMKSDDELTELMDIEQYQSFVSNE